MIAFAIFMYSWRKSNEYYQGKFVDSTTAKLTDTYRRYNRCNRYYIHICNRLNRWRLLHRYHHSCIDDGHRGLIWYLCKYTNTNSSVFLTIGLLSLYSNTVCIWQLPASACSAIRLQYWLTRLPVWKRCRFVESIRGTDSNISFVSLGVSFDISKIYLMYNRQIIRFGAETKIHIPKLCSFKIYFWLFHFRSHVLDLKIFCNKL